VTAELHSSVRLQFSADEKLSAAAGGVARYFADSAGMEADAVAKLQAATLAVCNAAIAEIPESSPELSVEVTRFADRIEVAITHQGARLEKIAAPPGVDRITQESQHGSTVIRLTKIL